MTEYGHKYAYPDQVSDDYISWNTGANPDDIKKVFPNAIFNHFAIAWSDETKRNNNIINYKDATHWRMLPSIYAFHASDWTDPMLPKKLFHRDMDIFIGEWEYKSDRWQWPELLYANANEARIGLKSLYPKTQIDINPDKPEPLTIQLFTNSRNIINRVPIYENSNGKPPEYKEIGIIGKLLKILGF